MALARVLGFSGNRGQVGTSLLPKQMKGSLWLQHTHFRAGLLTDAAPLQGNLKCFSKALQPTFNSGYSLSPIFLTLPAEQKSENPAVVHEATSMQLLKIP